MIRPRVHEALIAENNELHRKLQEAEEILQAIREGQVDALLTAGPEGDQVYTLRGAEYPYRILFEQMRDGAVTLMRDGTVLYANHRVAEMLGLPLERILGESLAQVILPEHRERLTRLLNTPLDSSQLEEINFRTAQGNEIVIRVSAYTWQLNDLEIVSLVLSDITERRTVERALRASEERFRLAVDNFPGILVIYDAQRRIQFMNVPGLFIAGLAKDEVIGHTDEELFPDQVTQSYLPLLQRAAESGMAQSAEIQVQWPTGPVAQKVTYVPLFDAQRQLHQILGIAEDITERKEAEDALRQSQQRLRSLFQGIPIPTFVFRRVDGEIILEDYNQAALELTDGEIRNAVGRPARDIYPGEPGILEHLSHCLEGKEVLRTRLTRLLGAPATERIFDATFACVDPDTVILHTEDITEHVHAEQEVLHQAHLLNLTYDGIFVRDMQGTITFWNRGSEELYGYPRQEALGKVTHSLLKTEFPAPLAEIEEETIRAGRWEGELVHTRRDGSRVVVASRWALQRDERGGPVAILEINNDVSERKHAEQALRTSEERFHRIFDQSPIGIGLVGPNWRWRSANPSLCRMFGYSEDELRAQTFVEVTHPDDVKEDVNRAVELFQQKIPEYQLDKRYIAKDGRILWAHISVSLLHDESENTNLRLVMVEDITERKQAEDQVRNLNADLERRIAERTSELEETNRALVNQIHERTRAEEALRESEAGFRLLAENAQDLVYRARLVPSVHFEYMSPSSLSIYGYTPEEIYADPDLIFRLIHPEDRPILEAIVRGELTSDEPRTLRWMRKDGRMVWLEQRQVPVYGENGALVAFEGIARDVTERRQTEEALARANENLKNRARELEQHNREVGYLNEMGDLLQSCLTVEEVYRVTSSSALNLFPSDSGALYMLNGSRNLLEEVASWGQFESGAIEHVFVPDNCWALRRGRVHIVEDTTTGLICPHVKNEHPDDAVPSYQCVPMVAQGETLGVFYLQANPGDGLSKPKERLAVSVAEHVALAVSSLRLRETLRNQAIRDPLTGLFNRRYMEESLERELRRAARKESPIGIVMLDLDHFKNWNDTYGHEAGDVILRAFGQFLQRHVREGDIACRYGGEEFTLILPDADREETRKRMEGLREEFKQLPIQFEGQPLGNLTVSIGLAVFPEQGATAEPLLRAADMALYAAKTGGRNRVVSAE